MKKKQYLSLYVWLLKNSNRKCRRQRYPMINSLELLPSHNAALLEMPQHRKQQSTKMTFSTTMRPVYRTRKTKSSWRKGYARQQCEYEGPLGNKSKLSRKTHPRTKHHLDRQLNRLRSYGHFCISPSKMTVTRHLGFLTFESCTIRSADPENPNPEPNIMSLCCIQPEIC